MKTEAVVGVRTKMLFLVVYLEKLYAARNYFFIASGYDTKIYVP